MLSKRLVVEKASCFVKQFIHVHQQMSVTDT